MNKVKLFFALLHLTVADLLAAKSMQALPSNVPFASAPIAVADLLKFEGRWAGVDGNDSDRDYFELRAVRAGVMEMRGQGDAPDAAFGNGPVYLTWHGGTAYMSLDWVDWKWNPKPPLPKSFMRRGCYAVSRMTILPGDKLEAELISEERTLSGNQSISFARRRLEGICLSDIVAGLSVKDRKRLMLIPYAHTVDDPPNILRRKVPTTRRP
jgi:hypothetical protein